MKIHIARDGADIGAFDLGELKTKAACGEVHRSDYAYVESRKAWALIEDVPELCAELFPEADDIPPPPPPPKAPVKEVIPSPPAVRSGPVPGEDEPLLQGYPLSYWQAYFGKQYPWYAEKLSRLPAVDGYGKRTTSLEGQALFAWPALATGLYWLVYRKVWQYYPILLAQWVVGWYLIRNDHLLGSIVLGLVINAFCWFYGLAFIRNNATSLFARLDSASLDLEARLANIQSEGSTSWLNVILFLVVSGLVNALLLG